MLSLVEAGGVEPTVRKNDHTRPATSVGSDLDFAPFGAHCQAPLELSRQISLSAYGRQLLGKPTK